MSAFNIAANLRGGARVTWRGASFLHRKPLNLPMKREVIKMDDFEAFAATFQSHDRVDQKIDFTSLGRATEITALVNRYATEQRGSLINIEEFPVTVNATTDVLTSAVDHLLADGDEIMLHWLITQPAPATKTTRYYARVTGASSSTLTVYDTKANALATGATTGKINFTTAGSGVVMSVARPLVVHFMNGLRITYYNAGLTKIPGLNFSGVETILDSCEFGIFARNGSDPDAPDFFAYDYAAFSDTTFDPADVLRQSPVLSWANGSPWTDGLLTRAGAKASIDLKTAAVESDAFGSGILGRYFLGLDVQVSAAVQGVTEAEAIAALKAQTAARGDDIGGDGALDIDTAGYNFQLADAALVDAPQQATAGDQRGKDFVWQAVPKFTAGVQDPIYELTEK